MDEKIEIIYGGPELLDRIAPLWEELNNHHIEKSVYFSKEIKSRSFESRKKAIGSKAKDLRADIAIDLKEKKDVGYCISTIADNNVGEIDSIFIREAYRKHGLGKKLMEIALAWLDDHGVVNRKLTVAWGNDEAVDFYKRFEFYPSGIQLVQKYK
jgi:diamine N-acetyltransferase